MKTAPAPSGAGAPGDTGSAISRPARPAVAWIGAALGTGAVFLGTFLLYFLVYRVRHFSLPLGWDTPWYVWRADYIGHVGIGLLDTASRPGHALLSATLTSLTGISSVRMEVVLPYVLVGMLALVIGALAAVGTGRQEWWRWAAAASVSGVTIGTTRLVGENVSNLMNLVFALAAFLLLIRFVVAPHGGWAGFVGALLLTAAAVLSHWLFMPVIALFMAAWWLLALPSSIRARRSGTSPVRTESGALFAAGGLTGVATLALIYPVLGSSFRTREIGELHSRYLPKFREDLSGMSAWAVAAPAAVGGYLVARPAASERTDAPERGPFLRMLAGWTGVCLLGIAIAAITLVVPPHRFLGLLVAMPMAIALGALVWTVGRWVARRTGRWLGIAAAAVIVGLLTIPTVAWWYGPADVSGDVVVREPAEGPEQWFQQDAYDQGRSIDAYLSQLPAGTPVVVGVGPLGSSGPISISLKERTIRAALAPEHQAQVVVIPGEPADLVAGRFTQVKSTEANDHNRPFFDDGASVLRSGAAIVLPHALGDKEFRVAVNQDGAKVIAPGVALLRGPPPASAIGAPPPLHVVPTTRAGALQAIALIVLLGVAGLGWALWFLGPNARPLTVLSLAPTAGAAVLILA
ncbi:MAG TPA: hypothetical protein VNN79_01930, partial [Actinomycetota bacterium]|nr:hypothetical protein [Actinomycetota bacterium]